MILNLAFITPRGAAEGDVIDYIRLSVAPAVRAGGLCDRMELMLVQKVQGTLIPEDEPLNYSLQRSFPGEKELLRFEKETLEELADNFRQRFQEKAFLLVTQMRRLPL